MLGVGPDLFDGCGALMPLAASPVQVTDFIERPRPFGRGRLVDWQLEQAVSLANGTTPTAAKASLGLTQDGLDPVIAWSGVDKLEMGFGPIARFVIDFAKQTVRLVEAHHDADQATIDHLLDDHVAPRIIASDGTLVLHGSATLIGSHIAVFLGLTGSGKSTLAASLHSEGFALLGDDAVVVENYDGTNTGEAVYPSLRLYGEAMEQVLAADLPTAAMAFYSDKRHVSLAGHGGTGTGRYPLGGIFVLADSEAGVALDRYAPAEGCMALLENSFAIDPADGAMAARRMGMAARVAAAVPCYELAYPYDFGLLGEVRRRVVGSFAHLSPPV